ncbi:MAG: alpha/beta hydrolase [Victivallales bacterium]|nr:alpha/beta hydrolase [Victivallales bacterium]
MQETLINSTCVELWPQGRMPGRRPLGAEHLHNPGRDTVIRVTSIQEPAMYVFPAEKQSGPAPLMVVCPGGGYSYMAWNLEGTEIASYLTARGMAAAVLKYRCPDNREGAFMDVQRAIRVARYHAKEWNIDPKRIGVMGFSAGGHLSAKAATGYNHPAYQPVDEIDELSALPDYAVLVYPAYLNDETSAETESNVAGEFLPLECMPPVLVLHNEDDPRYVKGSKALIAKMTEMGLDIQWKIWHGGGHGYGLRSQKEVKDWPNVMVEWFKSKGILQK